MSTGQQWWDDHCDAGVLGIGSCARRDCPLHGLNAPTSPEPQKLAPAAEMPEGSRWKPCAAGFDDGHVLLVAVPGGLCIVAKSGKPHLHMTQLTLEELRALLATQGLRVVREEECRVLEDLPGSYEKCHKCRRFDRCLPIGWDNLCSVCR